jgi:hypothetical protein
VGALVYLQAEIAKGDFRVTADVYPSMNNSWDRIRNPVPSPIAHAFASVKVDAEVRAFLAPLLLEQASVHKAKHDEGEVLAAACGDVDGDGGLEIALVSRARVVLGRMREGKLVVGKSAPWSALAPRAGVPMREPIGTAAIARGALFVGTTDRGGVSLGADFVKHAPLVGLPVPVGDGVACLAPNAPASALESPAIDCLTARDARDTKPVLFPPATRFDAFAAAPVVAVDGSARDIVAVREPSGKLRLKLGDATRGPDTSIGVPLAVGDLDQDGVAEIVTTVDNGEDAITVSSWNGGDLKPRLRLPAAAGVRALAVCPPEERAAPALVAVVGNEVWLVR